MNRMAIRFFGWVWVLALLFGCGGGGGSSDAGGSTETNFNVKMSVKGGKPLGAPTAYGIERIDLLISAADINPPIRESVPVSRQSEDIKDVVVPLGKNRHFEAKAYDARGLAYIGVTTTDLNGVDREVQIVMEQIPRIDSVGVSASAGTFRAMIGDTVKITGSGFGSERGSSCLTIGASNCLAIDGSDAVKTTFDRGSISIERWDDTVIIAVIPAGLSFGSAPVVVTVPSETAGSLSSHREQVGTLLTVEIVKEIYGIGGESGEGSLDKFTLAQATPDLVVLSDLTDSDGGSSSSVAVSGDGETAVEADSATGKLGGRVVDLHIPATLTTFDSTLAVGRDIAISYNGTVALVANGSSALSLRTGLSSSSALPVGISIPGPGDCLLEVALSADGNTAAVIGQQNPCTTGAFRIFRVDNVLSTPSFTSFFSSVAGEIYTDIAMSADGDVVIVGRHQGGEGGVYRLFDFTSAAPTRFEGEKVIALALPRDRSGVTPLVNGADVDISADGMTAVVALSTISGTTPEHYAYQILDADLDHSRGVFAFLSTCETSGVICTGAFSGMAVSAGGSVALAKVPQGIVLPRSLQRVNGFNQISPSTTVITPSSQFNNGFIRTQDQIDLQ